MRRPVRAWAVMTVLVGAVASACADGGPSEIERAAAALARPATTTTEPVGAAPTTAPARATTTSSTAAVTTIARVTTPTSAPAGLGNGSRGTAVASLEQRLDALRYDVGVVDDVYDQNTLYGVMAFQKVTGMARTGRATDDVVAALATATVPPALVPAGGENRVEVDIPRQVLFLYRGGALQRILTISSGNNRRFCSEGYCRNAVTPGGSFGIYRQGKGWEYGPLGGLYNPLYFNGGIAIHGSKSVPAQPASHGCIRIPMRAAEWFPSQVHVGMPVHVVGVEGQPPSPKLAAPAIAPPPSTTVAPTTTVPDLLGSLLRPPTP